jgi:hypothetical protein
MTKIEVHRWKSKNLEDGTGSINTSWVNGRETLFNIGFYNDRSFIGDLISRNPVYRGTNYSDSKLKTILSYGIDRIDTLSTSKMFWGSSSHSECLKHGGDRKLIMAYDPYNVTRTTGEERIEDGVEEEFRYNGNAPIYKFLTDPLEALIAVISIEPAILKK